MAKAKLTFIALMTWLAFMVASGAYAQTTTYEYTGPSFTSATGTDVRSTQVNGLRGLPNSRHLKLRHRRIVQCLQECSVQRLVW